MTFCHKVGIVVQDIENSILLKRKKKQKTVGKSKKSYMLFSRYDSQCLATLKIFSYTPQGSVKCNDDMYRGFTISILLEYHNKISLITNTRIYQILNVDIKTNNNKKKNKKKQKKKKKLESVHRAQTPSQYIFFQAQKLK